MSKKTMLITLVILVLSIFTIVICNLEEVSKVEERFVPKIIKDKLNCLSSSYAISLCF